MGLLGCDEDGKDLDASKVEFEGSYAIKIDQEAGTVPCLDEEGKTVIVIGTLSTGEGEATLFGASTFSVTVDSCVFNPADGSVSGPGTFTFANEDGDSITGPLTGYINPNFTTSAGGDIISGTGRFEGATGWWDSEGTLDPEEGITTFAFQGMVTPPQ